MPTLQVSSQPNKLNSWLENTSSDNGAAGAFRNWDDYFIPGTRTLRNLFVSDEEPFGVEDPEKLRVLESVNTEFRLNELATNPLPGNFDYAHMKAIHRHIFQDVYE